MIITIQNLKWSNWFSYGENNYISFDQPVLQVMGLNGTGKTSIPIILQEVYYGKNSKGKKKSSLVNRYTDSAELWAESEFTDEQDNKYKITLSRKSTLKLKLYKNGEDISSHTTTNTYKTIQSILGLDFSTFSQLIYQSSTDKLDFLTATDSNRKKFLINLFTLSKYLDIQDKFKTASSDVNTELVKLNSKITTISSWIDKHSNADLNQKDIVTLPELDNTDIDKMAAILSSIETISETNKKINSNNTYKDLLDNLDKSNLFYEGIIDEKEKISLNTEGLKLKKELIQSETEIKILNSNKSKIATLGDKCHSCKQEIPRELKDSMLLELEKEITKLLASCMETKESISKLSTSVKEISVIERELRKKEVASSEFARLTNAIDYSISDDVLSEKQLRSDLATLKSKIDTVKAEISTISLANTEASSHNSRIGVILEQLSSHNKDIGELKTNSMELGDTLDKLNILKKAFSPNGLLSYKLDYLVKDLENEINKYLGVLSGGKFQLVFTLENEKLDIKIIDEGMRVAIEELSAGELARINAATLLAIRKLMVAISSTKINVLFLDEIMGVLDEGGKEMLIEVLHKEKDLSTLLVSHEYSHPLIPKITIIKINKVSTIDHE